MSRKRSKLHVYKHQALMDGFNELNIRIKTYLFDIGDDEFKVKHPKPTVKEIDSMMQDIMKVLREDCQLIKKD